jgi:hypothetical protein
MAFFWAEEPDALSEPDTQLEFPLDEPDGPASEPHAARAKTPATAMAASRAVREMVTLVLQESGSMSDVLDARKRA